MRNRNKEFSKNIGDLMEEINNQDLEDINGGSNPIGDLTYLTVITKPTDYGCPVIPKLSDGLLCDIIVPVVTKALGCK